MRRIATVISAIPLLASVAIIALWARSYSVQDVFQNEHVMPSPSARGWRGVQFRSDRGVLALEQDEYEPLEDSPFFRVKPEPGWYLSHFAPRGNYRTPSERWLGIPLGYESWPIRGQGFTFGTIPQEGTSYAVWAPHWLVALVAATPGVMILQRRRRVARRRKRLAAGQCAACGYDLRATPHRCPECGAEPAGVPGHRTPA